jgi:hypothetical protein
LTSRTISRRRLRRARSTSQSTTSGAALLVGLDDEAEAVPARQRGLAGQPLEQVERQLEPLGLLGVDVQPDVVAARQQSPARAAAAAARPARGRAGARQ